MPIHVQVPYHLALILCDAVHADPDTGKTTILGTLSYRQAVAFPLTIPALAVYAVLSDGRGVHLVSADWAGPDDAEMPGTRMEVEIDFTDPIVPYEITFPYADLTFDGPGLYAVRLEVAGEFIVERRLMVIGPEDEHHEPSG
jgi:hypothetical protein